MRPPLHPMRGRAPLLALVVSLIGVVASSSANDDMADLLEGFDDDPTFAAETDEVDREPPAGERSILPGVDLSGSLALTGSVNLHGHRSATGTDFEGLQRFRMRAGLRLDVDLGVLAESTWGDAGGLDGWSARLAGWGFWDAAHLMNGRGLYTDEVLGVYELDGEIAEAWMRGSPLPFLDVKIGRQIVVWGRSDFLRVLDVLNPLDNREPGRVNLEDLRRPVGMVRVDAFRGPWTWTGIVVPEVRFGRDPVRGSDFFPADITLLEEEPDDFEDLELATAITGVFPGWDISLQGAWYWNDQARLAREAGSNRLVHDRLWMVGSGGNVTRGSFLWKYELALQGGLEFTGVPGARERIDAMVGVEYYGWADTTVIVEGVHRHVFGYDARLRDLPDFTREDRGEVSLLLTRNFWNDTLHVSVLAFLLGWDGRDGSLVRLDADYDVADALTVGVGLLLYQGGTLPPFSDWGRNDRFLFRAKWSF